MTEIGVTGEEKIKFWGRNALFSSYKVW